MLFKKVAVIAGVFLIMNLTSVFAGINEQGLGLMQTTGGIGNVSMQTEEEGGPEFGTVDGGTTKLMKEIRKNAVSLSVAWNGIAGVGLMYTYRPKADVAVDAGLGLSSMGFKYGVRGRYCFSRAKGSPFAGLGFMMGSGSPEAVDVPMGMSDGDTVDVNFTLNSISFLQLTGGYDYVANNGFTFIFAIGWAIALNEGVKNVTYDGVYTADEYRYQNEDAVEMWELVEGILYKGGLVLSLNAGFAF